MKLTYITNARVPSHRAHPYQTVKMCEAFAGHGVDVELVLRTGARTPEKSRHLREVWQYYGVSRHFRIKKLPSLNLRWLDNYATKHGFRGLGLIYYLLQATSFAVVATLYCLFRKTDIYYTRLHFFAYLLGSIIGVFLVLLKKRGMKSEVPFGPFLVVGTYLGMLYGEWVVYWYLEMM